MNMHTSIIIQDQLIYNSDFDSILQLNISLLMFLKNKTKPILFINGFKPVFSLLVEILPVFLYYTYTFHNLVNVFIIIMNNSSKRAKGGKHSD